MPFSVPERSQGRGGDAAVRERVAATVPEVGDVALGGRPGGRRLAGGLRPSQVPAAGALPSPWPGELVVQRAVAVRPGGTRVRPSAVSVQSVSAQPVRDVLRGAGRPLAGPVREEMEARLGADFSDVRVHDDAAGHSAARSVGARAFTAGSHIAFQRARYDPVSATGRQTLAHELAHVIQQRSGPVAGAHAGGGIRVSDPADHFERAAHASAQRALAHGRPSSGPPAAPGRGGLPLTPTGDAVPVQRAVGFEFELGNYMSSVHTITTNPDGTESRARKTDTKAPLKYLNAAGNLVDSVEDAYVSADNGSVEYVTVPLRTKAQVDSAIGSIVTFHTMSNDRGSLRKEAITGVDGRRYEISAGGKAKAQASLGVGLENITDLFRELRVLAKVDADAQAEPTRKKRRVQQKSPQEELNTRVGLIASYNTAEAGKLAGLVYGNIPYPRYFAIDPVEQKKIIGFLAIIFKIILDANDFKGQTLDDAKYAFGLMPRSDFVSMFHSINNPARGWLADNLFAAIDRTRELGGAWLDEDVFGKYKAEIQKPGPSPSKIYEGPSRNDWINSIITGAAGGKDLLSPPPGYPAHNTLNRRAEGMGAMGMDGSLAVFELRGIGQALSDQDLPPELWLPLARTVTALAARVTGDAALA
jgi:hypothetical protein